MNRVKRTCGKGSKCRSERPRRTVLEGPLARLVVTVLALLWMSEASAFGASDPYLQWKTIETEHFRIHSYQGLERIADRIAAVAEGVNRRIEHALGAHVSQVTEIVLVDTDDHAQGVASAIPYNTIVLHVAPPNDLFELGDYEDWYLTLVTHEHTHIVHTEYARGVPALVNAVFGRRLSPNQAQPKWIIEGLAVLEESRLTGGGRNRSSLFDMYLRADVIENRIAGIDEVSHSVRRWPQGNLWYLYGSRFVEWLTELYGDDVWKAIVEDYSRQIVSWGINRSVRRATGQTYEQLYPVWVRHLRALYADQLQRIEAEGGLREGTRITHHGYVVSAPRFVPPAARGGSQEEIVFYRDDGRSRSGLYRLSFADPCCARSVADGELLVRTDGQSSATFEPDGSLVYHSNAVFKRVYSYNDLFRIPPHAADTSGYAGNAVRLTEGERIQAPDLSADGTRLVFTKNHRGTTTLMLAERSPTGAFGAARVLVPSAEFEQAYTPRFSPDGRAVAYSAWTTGGYRDIRLVDLSSGTYSDLAHDRAMDWQPVFSPDGRYVFFSSDRSSHIPNIFAFDRTTHELWQVTNVRTGAFYPAISPDGRTLVYVGYTSGGYDLYTMPLERSSWRRAPAYVDARGSVPAPSEDAVRDRHPYDPLPSLRPRSYQLGYAPGTFGDVLQIAANAADVLGRHSVQGMLEVASEQASDPNVQLSYSYARLPFDLDISGSRYLTPVQYRHGGPEFVQSTWEVASSLSYELPTSFEINRFSFGYALSRGENLHSPPVRLDPDAPIEKRPVPIQLASVGMSWTYSNLESYYDTVGAASRGRSLRVNTKLATPSLASDYSIYTLTLSAVQYLPMPWAANHTLALRAEGGVSGGNVPNQRVFYLGGFADAPLIEPLASDPTKFTGRYQDAFVVRGFAPRKFAGTQYQLYTTEYRFPLLTVDRGYSTLPVFLRRISGAAFLDFGGAFDDLGIDHWTDKLHLGGGGELWLELFLGYYVSTFVRVGHARGIGDPDSIPGGQTYVVLSMPY